MAGNVREDEVNEEILYDVALYTQVRKMRLQYLSLINVVYLCFYYEIF